MCPLGALPGHSVDRCPMSASDGRMLSLVAVPVNSVGVGTVVVTVEALSPRSKGNTLQTVT